MGNFAETMVAIQAEDASLSERRLAVDQLTVGLDTLIVGELEFQFGDRAMARLCNGFHHRPKVPADYLKSLPERLRTELLSHHLEQGTGRDGTISVFSRGNKVVGFGRPDLGRLFCSDVLEAAAEGTGSRHEDLDINTSGVADEAFCFDLIVHRASHEVRRGDVVTAGLRVRHSPIGEFATTVEPYLLRLVCNNGAVLRECVAPRERQRTRRRPACDPRARDQQRDQVRRLAADAIKTLIQRFGGLAQLTSENIDFERFANHWLSRSRLSSQRLMPLLRQAHAEEGAEGTAYGIMNAFTRVATHNTALSPNIRNVLARMGGLLAFGHSRLCPKCWSLIAASN